MDSGVINPRSGTHDGPPGGVNPWSVFTAIGIFAGALLLYTVTLNADVQPADNGELQLAALTLSIPHPPGFPLFTLLGWLFSQVPFGSPYARVTYVSVLSASLALVLVYAAVRAAMGAGPRGRDSGFAIASGALAAIVLGTSTTFWAIATTTNIRSLTALFTALMVWSAIETDSRALARRRRGVMIFAVSLGLGLGHHLSLAFIGAVLLAFVMINLARAARRAHERLPVRSVLLPALGLFLATQLVWLLLPIRNGAGLLSHGDLATLSGFIDHVLARGFEGDFFYFLRTEPARMVDRLALSTDLLLFQFGAGIVIAATAAWLALIWRRTAVGLALLIAFAVHFFVTLTYRAPQTVEYALPCWVMLAIALGAGLAAVAELIGVALATRPRSLALAAQGILFAGLCAIALRDAAGRFDSYVQLARDDRTRSSAQAALDAAGPDGRILSQWHTVTPLWALQAVEGAAPGVSPEYVFPQGAQRYEDTFADRALAALDEGRPVVVTSRFGPEFAARGLCTEAMSVATIWRVARCDARGLPSAPQVLFDNRIAAMPPIGLASSIEAGSVLAVPARWRADGPVGADESLTFRLFRRDGRLAANADVRIGTGAPEGREVADTLMLGIPLDLEPGEYDLVVGAYRPSAAGFETLRGRTSRGTELDYAPLAKISVLPAEKMAPTQRQVATASAQKLDEPQLLGVDYDTGIPGQLRVYTHWLLGMNGTAVSLVNEKGAALGRATLAANPRFDDARLSYQTLIFDIAPARNLGVRLGGDIAPTPIPDYADGERYLPFGDQMALIGAGAGRDGGALKLDLRWLAGRPVTSDFKISARASGDGLFTQHDGTPALGAMPTLKWIRGSRVNDRHPLAVGDYRGRLWADVKVYDNITQLPLPMLDERYEQRQLPLFDLSGR